MKKIVTILCLILTLIPISSPLLASESYWLTGGLIGAGVGAGAGLGIGLGVRCTHAGSNNEDCDLSRSTVIAITIPAGTLVGFGIGALIGKTIKKKEKTSKISNPILPSLWADIEGKSAGAAIIKTF